MYQYSLITPELAPDVTLRLLHAAHPSVLVTFLVRTLDPTVTELPPEKSLIQENFSKVDLLVAVIVCRDEAWLGNGDATDPLHLLLTYLVCWVALSCPAGTSRGPGCCVVDV